MLCRLVGAMLVVLTVHLLLGVVSPCGCNVGGSDERGITGVCSPYVVSLCDFAYYVFG